MDFFVVGRSPTVARTFHEDGGIACGCYGPSTLPYSDSLERLNVEPFGARNTHWVSARIDPNDPNLFRFEPRIVPENAQ